MIKPKNFALEEYHRFQQYLSQEIEHFREFVAKNNQGKQDYKFGVELEAWLTEKDYKATPKNDWMLKQLNSSNFVPELSKYNIEYNSNVYAKEKMSLTAFEKELIDAERSMNDCASNMDAKVLLIGSLPHLNVKDFNLNNMTNKERYFTLNDQICKKDSYRPTHYYIEGEKDRLEFKADSIMPVAATTSFQMHYQMPFEDLIKSYNASQFISAILMSVSANTPYLFGKNLWEDSRIPLFEQSISNRGYKVPRVGMGFGYLKEDVCEFFCNNHEEYEAFIPEIQEYQLGQFHLNRMHNGTIWHWNRVIVDGVDDKNYEARIEFRPCSAGPTPVDMTAHFAFYIGLMKTMSKYNMPELVSFSKAQKNFYECAKFGLDAEIYDISSKKLCVRDYIVNELIDLAMQGLHDLGINKTEAKYYLEEILKPRVEQNTNASRWQKTFLEKNGHDFEKMLDLYWHNQRKNIALRDWEYAV